MNDQGFLGALDQYWSIEEKPRLHRRNSFFDEAKVTNAQALRFGLAVSVLATAIIISWSIVGGLL